MTGNQEVLGDGAETGLLFCVFSGTLPLPVCGLSGALPGLVEVLALAGDCALINCGGFFRAAAGAPCLPGFSFFVSQPFIY